MDELEDFELSYLTMKLMAKHPARGTWDVDMRNEIYRRTREMIRTEMPAAQARGAYEMMMTLEAIE